MLPFHTSQEVVGGYVRNSDGSIDHAGTRSLAKALGRPTGPGEMSPEEARALPKGKKDRKKKQSKW